MGKKEWIRLSNKTLNWLLAVALILMLFPFLGDMIAGNREGRSPRAAGDTDPSKVTVIDEAGILSEEEAEKLKADMLPITAHYPVAFVSARNTEGRSIEDYAEKRYLRIYGFGTRAILFLMIPDPDQKEGGQLYLLPSSRITTLSQDQRLSIIDNISPYAREGQYYECTRLGFFQMNELLAGRTVRQPMRHMSNLLLSIGFALLIVFVIANAKAGVKRHGVVYQLDKNMHFEVKLDQGESRLIRTRNWRR